MDDKIFHLQPWNPELKRTAYAIIDHIHQASPELEVLFMGAGALELPGENDIDLDILCATDDIPSYTQKLTPLLDEPTVRKETLTAWRYVQNGFEVDAILSDPKVSHVPKQRAVFEKLQANAELRAQYLRLKQECNGLPLEIYKQKKVAFFEDVVLRQD